jgi:NADH:ubiquinone oxidoreductase subunit 6 (subunit J)
MLIVYRVTLVAVLFLCAGATLLSKSLVRAALALGAGSAALAMLFFSLDAPYAGGFELSVGTGLISVFFLIGISLTRSPGEVLNDRS